MKGSRPVGKKIGRRILPRPSRSTEEESDSSDDAATFDTPRAPTIAECMNDEVVKLQRHDVANAAKVCMDSLQEIGNDLELEERFRESVQMWKSSVPSATDCAVAVMVTAPHEFTIGDTLKVTCAVRFLLAEHRVPSEEDWLGLYPDLSSIRRLLKGQVLKDVDLRSIPDLGLIARIPMARSNLAELSFPSDALHQPAPPGVYEVRYYMKGNPVPFSVSNPICSMWPEAKLSCETELLPGNILRVEYEVNCLHERDEHSIELWALDLAPWQTSEQKEIFEDNLIGSFVSSISVPAGSQKGKVVFDNADIIPGRYFYVYRLNAEFSNDGRGLIIARSSLCLLRVSLPVEKHRISVRVFHIYIAANAGPEMEKERTEMDEVVLSNIRQECAYVGWEVNVMDLRASIHDDSDPRLLGLCLQSLESSRNGAFVCLLGEKYGDVLSEIPRESSSCLKERPWIRNICNPILSSSSHTKMAASVLEVECTTAFLLCPSEMPGALFYFRDSQFAYQNQKGSSDTDFLEPIHRRAVRSAAMENLKGRLETANDGKHVRKYKNPKDLGKILLKDLIETFNRLHTSGSKKRMGSIFRASKRGSITDLNESFASQLDANTRKNASGRRESVVAILKSRLPLDYARGSVSIEEARTILHRFNDDLREYDIELFLAHHVDSKGFAAQPRTSLTIPYDELLIGMLLLRSGQLKSKVSFSSTNNSANHRNNQPSQEGDTQEAQGDEEESEAKPADTRAPVAEEDEGEPALLDLEEKSLALMQSILLEWSSDLEGALDMLFFLALTRDGLLQTELRDIMRRISPSLLSATFYIPLRDALNMFCFDDHGVIRFRHSIVRKGVEMIILSSIKSIQQATPAGRTLSPADDDNIKLLVRVCRVFHVEEVQEGMRPDEILECLAIIFLNDRNTFRAANRSNPLPLNPVEKRKLQYQNLVSGLEIVHKSLCLGLLSSQGHEKSEAPWNVTRKASADRESSRENLAAPETLPNPLLHLISLAEFLDQLEISRRKVIEFPFLLFRLGIWRKLHVILQSLPYLEYFITFPALRQDYGKYWKVCTGTSLRKIYEDEQTTRLEQEKSSHDHPFFGIQEGGVSPTCQVDDMIEGIRDSFEKIFGPSSKFQSGVRVFASEDEKREQKTIMNIACQIGIFLCACAAPVKQEKPVVVERLIINVVEAKGLPKMDLGTTGTVDPYVIVRCHDKEFRTKVKRGNYSPVWNESFVYKGIKPEHSVRFEVWDWDAGEEDNHDFIGAFQILTQDVIEALEHQMALDEDDDEIDVWFDLLPSEDHANDVVEGGMNVIVKGSVRLQFRHEVIEDYDEDVAMVPLARQICDATQSLVSNALHVILETEIEMPTDLSSGPVRFPHASSTCALLAGDCLYVMRQCLDLLLQVLRHQRKEVALATRFVEKAKSAALKQRRAMQQAKDKSKLMSSTPAHVQQRLREEESNKINQLKASQEGASDTEKFIRQKLTSMGIIYNCSSDICSIVLRNDFVEEQSGILNFFSADETPQNTTSVEQAEEAKETLEEMGKFIGESLRAIEEKQGA